MQTLRSGQFAWIAQAALIVLPVAGLSGVALHFLHEDKAGIEQDAGDRANSLAPEMARRIGETSSKRISEELKAGRVQQGEIVNGRGLAVPDYSRLPEPSDWLAKLPPVEATLWQTAEDASSPQDQSETARLRLAKREAGLSASLHANFRLASLVAAEHRGDTDGLIHQAVLLADQHPNEVTESGAQVAGLALLVALRHVAGGNPPEELLSEMERNIVEHPSFLSPEVLSEADRAITRDPSRGRVKALLENWPKQEEERERTREVMRELAGQLAGRNTASVLSYTADRGAGLALCAPTDEGWKVTLAEGDVTGSALRAGLPNYMGAMFDGEPREANITVLASSPVNLVISSQSSDRAYSFKTYPLNLILYLANPDLLYASYSRRLVLTEWLIFAAAAVALLGLWRLWQTYLAQARLSELKSNLVSSVSHELRAPIAAVRLMAESLESGRVEGETKQKDYYRLIVRECRRLSSLVENVLDFARIDQGRKQYHFEPVDPAALLRHTMMLMEPVAAEREVRLTPMESSALEDLDLSSLPSWDGEAVEQSLVNLIDNAIKHSPVGQEVRLEVEVSTEFIRLWVSDKGPGIPAAEQQRIFDLFYRHGSELRRETQGAGIGLSIVKHVAEAHGGRVLVESVVGQGSRFGLELPK